MAKAKPVKGLSGDEPFASAAAKITTVRVGELWERRDGVTDVADIEALHDMRVAGRRLRAVLEILEPCFDAKAHAAALRDVKSLTDALGARRDPDVQIDWLRRQAAAASAADRVGIESLIDALERERAAANELLATELERLDGASLRERLSELPETAATAAGKGAAAAGKNAPPGKGATPGKGAGARGAKAKATKAAKPAKKRKRSGK